MSHPRVESQKCAASQSCVADHKKVEGLSRHLKSLEKLAVLLAKFELINF